MNFDILGHWKGGAIKDAGDEAIRLYGGDAINNINIGLLENLYGANPEDVKNYIKTKQQKQLNADPQIELLAIQSGLKPFEDSGGFADYGDTRSKLLARIQTAAEAKKKKADDLQRSRNIEDGRIAQSNAIELLTTKQSGERDALNAQLKSDAQNLSAKLQAASDQNAFTASENARERRFTERQNQLTRQQELELSDSKNSLQMQMALMNNDLADKRMDYDRETARLDRRDRAIAELVAGIGGLSSFFA